MSVGPSRRTYTSGLACGLRFALRLPAPLTFPIVGLLHLEPLERASADIRRLRVLHHKPLVPALDHLPFSPRRPHGGGSSPLRPTRTSCSGRLTSLLGGDVDRRFQIERVRERETGLRSGLDPLGGTL